MDTQRRNWCRLIGAAALGACLPAAARGAATGEALRIGITPLILDDHLGVLGAWREYLERRLARPVRFLQRGSYREISDLLFEDIEFAWLGGVPYVRQKRRLTLVAVPLFQGQPRQRSYLIVPDTDGRTRTLLDLRGKVFGYADPDSHAGYVYTQYELIRLGQRPREFFAKTFFTWAHRKAIEAVAVGLADGAMVDGYLWEAMRKAHPEVTNRTRVVSRSQEFGFSPIVAHADVPARDVDALRRALLEMHDDAGGRIVLARLNLDGFVAGDPSLYDGIAEAVRAVGEI